MIFGRLIDSTCLIWQEKCDKRGSCLLYDVIRFRDITHGTAAAANALGVIVCIIGWLVIRKIRKFSHEKKDNTTAENNSLSQEMSPMMDRDKSDGKPEI